ncbi:unnamed protein product [Rotaria magnacalcarata]|uniref:Uncharacterized protein n=1 Tax=Rotaria magnacalcarata TaxID=392030 RepID=A0A815ANJ2_9BILA|nr:unnamed protein product [Rotaria magnacalcarata]
MPSYKWLMFETKGKSEERIRQISLSHYQRNKVGRKSYHELYPEIITELKKLLNTHSGSAQDRRRDDAIHFNGLSIVDCAPAVSRYVRSRKFHLVDKQPNLPDHDFPRHGIRINPSAYAVLSNQRKRSSSIDSHPSYWCTVYNLGRFWEEQKLDVLIWVSYAPGHSRFNPIERMFSRLTDLLQGVIFDLDPSFKEKSQQVDMALVELCKYWNDKKFCNYKIDCRPMFSVNGNLFDGHEKLKNLFMNKAQIQIKQNTNIQFSLQLYLCHCVRSIYYTSFIKCNDKYCVHCSRYPICATKTMSLLRAGGGYIPWPTMTYSNKHYDTFLQRAYAILFGERNLYPDEHLLSGPKVTCSKCKLPYVFLSKADEERHNQWIHAPTQELKRSSTGVNKIVKRKRSLSPEY